ncbi:hypothetical protein KP806_16615 [Paenibacillus sp. N4]|uniref:DUF6483 family protein n=1 Tax=Paenibacillus vietnamensis TaxID=2590547 RepID=UPI001CD0810D|nr:DUF6483 family protein [Paenibacillus vietnamensis]MCA0756681.1 hypothetical protein [Paenibacillus vietnamensis]
MFQRDYFMRMIEQMTEAVGQILQLGRERKHEEALLLIDDLLEKKFRLSSKLIRSLSDGDLIKMMSTNGILETGQLQAIALLLKQEAIISADLGREDDAFAANVKALQLFIRLSLAGAEPTLADPREQASELLETLRPYELPIPAKRLLVEWHVEEGRYAEAENVLYELLEEQAIWSEEAAEIYRGILRQTDEKLIAGGLPREEVEQGLEALMKS